MSEPTQLERLARPIPDKYVKPPAPGQFGHYVPHYVITQWLLTIVGPFDMEVPQVFTSPEGLIEGCLVTLTLTIDGRRVSITEAGECDNAEKKKTQGDRMKNAVSDAIKRCATRVGAGLHLAPDQKNEDYFLYRQLQLARGEGEAANGRAPGAEPSPEIPAVIEDAKIMVVDKPHGSVRMTRAESKAKGKTVLGEAAGEQTPDLAEYSEKPPPSPTPHLLSRKESKRREAERVVDPPPDLSGYSDEIF